MGATHTHAHQALNHLRKQSQYLLSQSIAPSTKKNYNSALRSFHFFCNHYSIPPYPPSEQTLILYATHISSYSSHSNVKLHMAAVKHSTVIQGHQVDFRPFQRLYLLLRGIKRAEGKKFSLPKRFPITPDILATIRENLFNSSILYEDKLMLWAAITTAFFGFLRVSEYTSTHKTKYDPQCTLTCEDLSLTRGIANIVIKASKTDPFRHGMTIRLAANDSLLCPINALREYLSVHPSHTGPLFTYQNNKFLTRKDINQILHRTTNGLANTTSHSLRIGAATTAAAMGCPKWLIMSLGRWSSDCFRRYIRISDHAIINTSEVLANCTNPITQTFYPYE